jgi:hypothetical protein
MYENFSYNLNTDKSISYTADYKHTYEAHCDVTSPLASTYFVYVAVWGLIGIVYA